MKIAIIGAGIAGLSCACELERNGVSPTIFEKKSYIYNSFDTNICIFNNSSKLYSDPIEYLRKQYGIELHPIARLTKVILNGPDNQTILEKNLGYIFKRGMEEYSLSNQLSKNLKSPITFDTYINSTEELSKSFDHVVVATGNYNIAKSLDLSTSVSSTRVKLALIYGEFETGTLTVWFDEKFAKSSYAYMIAHSNKQAIITLVVNDVSYSEMEFYWKEFLSILENKYTFIATVDLDYYTFLIKHIRINNTFFIGNSGGLIDDFLGHGIINSIESGVLAARTIITGDDYVSAIQPLIDEVKGFRKSLTSFEDSDYSVENFIFRLPGLKGSFDLSTMAR